MTTPQERKRAIYDSLNARIIGNKDALQRMYTVAGDYYNQLSTYLSRYGGGTLLKKAAEYKSLDKMPDMEEVADGIAKDLGYEGNVRARTNIRNVLRRFTSKHKVPLYIAESALRNSVDSNYWWKNIITRDTNMDYWDDITILDDDLDAYANDYKKDRANIDQLTNDFIKVKSLAENAESSLIAANNAYAKNQSALLASDDNDIEGYYYVNDFLDTIDRSNQISDSIAQSSMDRIAPYLDKMQGVTDHLNFINDAKARGTSSNSQPIQDAYAYSHGIPQNNGNQNTTRPTNASLSAEDQDKLTKYNTPQGLSLDNYNSVDKPLMESVITPNSNQATGNTKNTSTSNVNTPENNQINPTYFSSMKFPNSSNVNIEIDPSLLLKYYNINKDMDPSLYSSAIASAIQESRREQASIASAIQESLREQASKAIQNSMTDNIINSNNLFNINSFKQYESEQAQLAKQAQQKREQQTQEILDDISNSAGKGLGFTNYWSKTR